MAETANQQIALDLRLAALRPELIVDLFNKTQITARVMIALLNVAADILDIYDEGGVDLEQWESAQALVSLLGGKIYPPGTPAPSRLVIR
jgi:hypothetical protein